MKQIDNRVNSYSQNHDVKGKNICKWPTDKIFDCK